MNLKSLIAKVNETTRGTLEAAAGLWSQAGEAAAARWLDAEDATMGQVLAWAMGRDREAALRLAAALGWWWLQRGRLPGVSPLLAELAG